MEELIRLIEKRREVGKRPSYKKGGNYNDYIEYTRLGELIINEAERLYDAGRLMKNS